MELSVHVPVRALGGMVCVTSVQISHTDQKDKLVRAFATAAKKIPLQKNKNKNNNKKNPNT